MFQEEQSDTESSEGSKSKHVKAEDEDFEANSSSEDDEDTIQEQEQVEGEQNHEKELEDLKAENEMSIEELRKKYSSLPPAPEEDSNMSATGTEDSASQDNTEESELSESDMDIDVDDSESQDGEVGLKSLLDDSQSEGETTKTDKNNDLINDAAAIAESIQPKGNTLSSTSVSFLYYCSYSNLVWQ